LRRVYIERKSAFIAGTAILGAVVAVLDVGVRLKIPFPIFPILKFDVMGIPMVLAYLSFGLLSGIIACLVAFATISFRDSFSGFMKFLAEAATIIGAYIIVRVKSPHTSHKSKMLATFSSVILRVAVMAAANFLLLPMFTTTTTQAVAALLPFICLFNALQGAISIAGGFLIYEAVIRRLPSLTETVK